MWHTPTGDTTSLHAIYQICSLIRQTPHRIYSNNRASLFKTHKASIYFSNDTKQVLHISKNEYYRVLGLTKLASAGFQLEYSQTAEFYVKCFHSIRWSRYGYIQIQIQIQIWVYIAGTIGTSIRINIGLGNGW